MNDNETHSCNAGVSKLQTMDQVWSVVCFSMAQELNIFKWLKTQKRSHILYYVRII